MRTILFVGADAAYMFAFRGPLIRAYLARGDRVVVLATALEGFDPARDVTPGTTYQDWPVQKAGLNPVKDLPALRMLWDLLRRERPQIVFAHTIKPVIYALTLSRIFGAPRRTAMIPGLGYAFIEGGGLRRRIVSATAASGYRLALGGAHMVLLQNADDLAALRRVGALPASTPTALVNGSGVDMDHHGASEPPDGPTTFLMVARLLRDKGVYEFVEAARRVKTEIPDARFVLVGAADSNPAAIPQDEVDQWVSEGLIEARGRLADPRPEFQACHVFVLPSYREGTPRTNLEAMSAGRAIITTDAPGCRETVTHGVNGLLAPPRDAGALAEAMLELARDPARVREMGRAGRAICADRYELAKVARETLSLIEGEPWTTAV